MLVDGVELHWTEQGTGSPLVLFHGLGDSQCTWAPVIAELAKKHWVLALDLPGCGRSARPADATYSLDWQARLAAAWVDRVGIRHFHVVGHSYGGGLALWLLFYRARCVRKMALIAPGGLGLEVSPLLRLAAILGTFEGVAEALIRPLTWLVVHGCGRSLPVGFRRTLLTMNCCPGTARALARTVRDVVGWRGQTRQLVHHIHQVRRLPPIALFWGEEDRIIPVEHGRALCELLENCSLWQFPGRGHFLHWESPVELAEAVQKFLDAPAPAYSRLRAPRTGDRRGARLFLRDADARKRDEPPSGRLVSGRHQ